MGARGSGGWSSGAGVMLAPVPTISRFYAGYRRVRASVRPRRRAALHIRELGSAGCRTGRLALLVGFDGYEEGDLEPFSVAVDVVEAVPA
jgi:hypothetical protein